MEIQATVPVFMSKVNGKWVVKFVSDETAQAYDSADNEIEPQHAVEAAEALHRMIFPELYEWCE